MTLQIAGTWYVPEGETHRIELPSLRDGNEEGRAFVVDDRGTLFLPCYVEEADTDDLVLLQQYNAGRLVETLRSMEEYGDMDVDGGVFDLTRRSSGYDLEKVGVDSLSDAM